MTIVFAILGIFFTPVTINFIYYCWIKKCAIKTIAEHPELSDSKVKSIAKIVTTDFTKFNF